MPACTIKNINDQALARMGTNTQVLPDLNHVKILVHCQAYGKVFFMAVQYLLISLIQLIQKRGAQEAFRASCAIMQVFSA